MDHNGILRYALRMALVHRKRPNDTIIALLTHRVETRGRFERRPQVGQEADAWNLKLCGDFVRAFTHDYPTGSLRGKDPSTSIRCVFFASVANARRTRKSVS